MLHYKLNFPVHCATLSTKVQHPRNKNHRLEEGTVLGKGGPTLATKSCLWGQIWQLKVVWVDHFWLFRVIYAVYTRTNSPLKDTKVTPALILGQARVHPEERMSVA